MSFWSKPNMRNSVYTKAQKWKIFEVWESFWSYNNVKIQYFRNNCGKNNWNKVGWSSKIREDQVALVSTFKLFLFTTAKCLFLEGNTGHKVVHLVLRFSWYFLITFDPKSCMRYEVPFYLMQIKLHNNIVKLQGQ